MAHHPVAPPIDSAPGEEADVTESEPSVRLLIPSSPRHLRLARVTASTMATDLDFGLADIEDLRVAVDELAALLIQDCPADAVLELRFAALDGGLHVTGEVTGPSAPTFIEAPVLHPVARELLDLVSDRYTVAPAGGARSFELVKRRRNPEA